VSGGIANHSSRTRLGWIGTTCGNERVRSPSSLHCFDLDLTSVPARKFTMMTAVSDQPWRKDQDMGGFPGPVDLFQRLVNAGALCFIDRTWNRIMTHWQVYGQRHCLSWLPDGIDGLTIGRNSDFYTDGLTDEQLEQLGSIEYHALSFLSYFVFAVSVEPGFHWFTDHSNTLSISWRSILYL